MKKPVVHNRHTRKRASPLNTYLLLQSPHTLEWIFDIKRMRRRRLGISRLVALAGILAVGTRMVALADATFALARHELIADMAKLASAI